MKDLSLHILDIVQNSITAGAEHITVSLVESEHLRTLTVQDDGRGMAPEFLRQVTDPFTTTRTTRKVGLGLPLLKMAAELSGGQLDVDSTEGVGTRVIATFDPNSIDCLPLGDLAESVAVLVQGLPETLDLSYIHRVPWGEFDFHTKEIRDVLGAETPLSTPDVALWVQRTLEQGEAELLPVDHSSGWDSTQM